MDTKTFTSCFDSSENKFEIAQLYDIYKLASNGVKVCTKKFYTVGVYNIIKHICTSEGIECKLYSRFDFFERGIIVFNDMDVEKCNVSMIKITSSNRFRELLHKDYLGSILSLGLERNRLGDLVVKDGSCYAMICNDIEIFLKENLINVGNSPVDIEVVYDDNDIPECEFIESVVLVASMRLDNFVSELTRLSRAKAEKLILSGSVSLNYIVSKDKSKLINKGDILTIRKYGKFIVDVTLGNSKSGRLRVVTKKFT